MSSISNPIFVPLGLEPVPALPPPHAAQAEDDVHLMWREQPSFGPGRARLLHIFCTLSLVWLGLARGVGGVFLSGLPVAALVAVPSIAALLLYANISWTHAWRAARSYVFAVSFGAGVLNCGVDAAHGGEAPAMGLVLLVVLALPLLHLSGKAVLSRTGVGMYLAAVVVAVLELGRQSITERDATLFSVGHVSYTYLSLRRACVSTMVTTGMLLVMQAARPSTAHANPCTWFAARQADLRLERALLLPPRAITTLRAAVLLQRKALQRAQSAESHAHVGAGSTSSTGPCASLLALQPGRLLSMDEIALQQSAWLLAHVACELSPSGLRLPPPRPPPLLRLAGVMTALALCAFLTKQVAPRAAQPGAASAALLFSVAALVAVFRGNVDAQGVLQVLALPSSVMTLLWTVVTVVTDLYLAWLSPDWVARASTGILTGALLALMTGFVLLPAIRYRLPGVEVVVTASALLSQLYNLAGLLLSRDDSPVLLRLPMGGEMTLNDLKRAAYAQLLLCLARLCWNSAKQWLRVLALRGRRLSAAQLQDELMNTALGIPLPRVQDVPAVVVQTLHAMLAPFDAAATRGVGDACADSPSPPLLAVLPDDEVRRFLVLFERCHSSVE